MYYDAATQSYIPGPEDYASGVPPSVYREAAIANPYYNMPGSQEAYEQYGVPPVLVQNQPYATAAYRTDPYGGVSPLIGYPSVYPHVLNGVPQDYAAPYVMGGGNFAAGGTYGVDPNAMIQQAQGLVARMMQGAPQMSSPQQAPIAAPAAPMADPQIYNQTAASHSPFVLPELGRMLPPPSGGNTPTPPSMVPALAASYNQLAASHQPAGVPVGFPGLMPSHDPYPAYPPAPVGYPGTSLEEEFTRWMATQPRGQSAGDLSGMLAPAPMEEVPVSMAAQGGLSPSEQYQWNNFLDTGVWRSTLYNTPADFAAAKGLTIPAGRDLNAVNLELDYLPPAAAQPTAPASSAALLPTGDPNSFSAMQQALAAVYNNPEAPVEDQIRAYLTSMQLPAMFLTGQLGAGMNNLGTDLAQALRNAPPPNTAGMLMPKPVMTPMGPVLVP